MLFYLTISWAGHVHIKHNLTLILIWTWRPVRTESRYWNEKKELATTTFKMHLMGCYPYLLQEELLWLDSCCASRRIFSMSPLWIEEDDGTCSSPPIRVSSLSGTTSKVCRVWLMAVFAFIWSSAGVIGMSVCTSWTPVFPLISSSTQEPWQHKGQEEGKRGN